MKSYLKLINEELENMFSNSVFDSDEDGKDDVDGMVSSAEKEIEDIEQSIKQLKMLRNFPSSTDTSIAGKEKAITGEKIKNLEDQIRNKKDGIEKIKNIKNSVKNFVKKH